jgi:RNA polymerase sigma-70 factor (ECF subfamily)
VQNVEIVKFWGVSTLAFAASVTVTWSGAAPCRRWAGCRCRAAGYAAVVGEAKGPEAGQAALDGLDSDDVSAYQPDWAVRAHLLQRLGETPEAADAFERAIGLEESAVRQFLLQRRG